MTPASPWLLHSGGVYEPEQRADIRIVFPAPAHAITMESRGALKCSGASLGRMIGYRDDVEVVNVSNALINPADCGADDVTFGVQGQIPASVVMDSLIIQGPDPWTFDVFGQPGRARLEYTITYDSSPTVECDVVTRGQMATCRILGTVESVSGWRFVGPVLLGLNDSVRVNRPSAEATWPGVGVVSGTVSAFVTIGGAQDTLAGSLTVNDRSGLAWRWDNGSKWTFRQDGPPLCTYVDVVVPGSNRLAVNRRTSTCVETDPVQDVSIEPSVRAPASADSGFTADSVRGGPNDGLWYVTSVSYYIDRSSEMNPFIRPGGRADTLTNSTDQRVCRQALNLPKNATVVVNFHTYNTVCRSFGLTALFNAIWSHEGFGTNNPLDPNLANGHEARRRIATRDSTNDPYRLAEPLVQVSYADLRRDLSLDVDDADQRISASADPDHAFVKNNYLVSGNCGKAWVFNTSQQAYTLIPMQRQLPNGTFVCL